MKAGFLDLVVVFDGPHEHVVGMMERRFWCVELDCVAAPSTDQLGFLKSLAHERSNL